MPIKIPPIYEFPKDGGLWRIDWLGAVHRTSAEALIDVFLSPAKSGIRNPSRQSDFDSDQVELVKIGIGQIPFLTIGSLWRDRCRVGHVIATMTTFRSVKINADTVRLVNAGAVRTEKPKRYFQIPPFKHAIQKDAWSSQCLAIEHNGDKYGILLPVSEAIRFYYAVSTDMAQVVFDGLLRFNRNSVINEAMSGMLQYSQRMVLQLRQWLADDDGWIIARMLLDSNAESGATQAFNSMMRDSIKGQLVFPECGLPFEGTTRWHARCIELQMNNERPRWLIQELMSCSAPFPFEELEIIRDNDGRQAQNPYDDLPDEEKKPAWAGPRKIAKSDTEIEMQSATPPDANIAVVETSSAGERFEALWGKQVIKTPKSACPYMSPAPFFGNLEAITAFSTGQSSAAETAVAPLRVRWDRERDTYRTPGMRTSRETLSQVVWALYALGCEARVRPGTTAITYLPLSKPAQYGQWSYIDSRRKTRRETIIMDMTYQGIEATLVEFELRGGERCQAALFVSMGKEHIANAELALLFHRLVEFEGVWARIESVPQGFTLKLIRHNKPSAATFAEAICAVIKS